MNTFLLIYAILVTVIAIYAFVTQRRVPWHYDQRIEYLEKVNGQLKTEISQIKLDKDSLQKQAEYFKERAEVSLRNEEHYKKLYNDEKVKIHNLNADESLKYFSSWTKSNNN